jgi:hypothetical protein
MHTRRTFELFHAALDVVATCSLAQHMIHSYMHHQLSSSAPTTAHVLQVSRSISAARTAMI